MISSLLAKLGAFHAGLDSDYADRLNFRYTSTALIAMGVLITTRQLVGEPIVCWAPNSFSSQWIKYTDSYCWVTNTFAAPLDTHYKDRFDSGNASEVKYYQWVPLILFTQALFFILPHILWRSVYQYAGFDFEEVAKHATAFEIQIDDTAWRTLIHKLARHIDRYLELQKSAGKTWCGKLKSLLSGRCIVSISRHYGNFLTYTYPIIKALFILNILAQLYVLSLWIGEPYRYYGITVLSAMILKGGSFGEVTTLFPRKTWCEVEQRSIDDVFGHTIPCTLPINLFNEMIFLVVWYWFAAVFAITSINLTRWFLNCSYMGDEYIRKHLKFSSKLQTSEDKKLLKRFLNGYLKQDGVFIIRMLSRNTTSIFISDLLAEMFELHRIKITEQRNQQRLERAAQNTSFLPGGSTLDTFHSEENLLFSSGPPTSPPPLPPHVNGNLPPADTKPPPLYQRFATNLDVTSTRSCDNLSDKKKSVN